MIDPTTLARIIHATRRSEAPGASPNPFYVGLPYPSSARRRLRRLLRPDSASMPRLRSLRKRCRRGWRVTIVVDFFT